MEMYDRKLEYTAVDIILCTVLYSSVSLFTNYYHFYHFTFPSLLFSFSEGIKTSAKACLSKM